MRHDYDLPAEWPAMSATERDRWFHQERARRQAERQETAFAARQAHDTQRLARRLAARLHGVFTPDR
jgi:hypothetical protein